jgi:nitrite reductase (NADH) small subunit
MAERSEARHRRSDEGGPSMTWEPICLIDRLTPDRGVAAMVGGRQVAVFLLSTGELYAIDNGDPFSGANVLSRGLVGDVDGVPTVASPVYKQRFDLRTGACVDDGGVKVGTWRVRKGGGIVELAVT